MSFLFSWIEEGMKCICNLLQLCPSLNWPVCWFHCTHLRQKSNNKPWYWPNIESNLTGVSIHIKCGILTQEPILKLSSTIASVLIVKQKATNYTKTIQNAKDFFLLFFKLLNCKFCFVGVESIYICREIWNSAPRIDFVCKSFGQWIVRFFFILRTHPQILCHFFYCFPKNTHQNWNFMRWHSFSARLIVFYLVESFMKHRRQL